MTSARAGSASATHGSAAATRWPATAWLSTRERLGRDPLGVLAGRPREPRVGRVELAQRRRVDHRRARDLDRALAPRGAPRPRAAAPPRRRLDARRSRAPGARRRPRSGGPRSGPGSGPSRPGNSHWTKPNRARARAQSLLCACDAGRVTGSAYFDGVRADRRVLDLAQAVDQLDPLLGLEDRVDLAGHLRVRAEERLEARRGCGRRGRPSRTCCRSPRTVISEMIWCGFIVPCRVSRRWIVSSVIEPVPWWPARS